MEPAFETTPDQQDGLAFDGAVEREDALPEPTIGGPQPDLREDPLAVDTHCHLFLMKEEPARVVAAARGAGVGTLVCVGIDPDSSRRSAELAQSFRGVFATAGIHPHAASGFDRRAGAVIEELLADPLVVGVGETGLDYYRMLSPIEDQQRALRSHVALSRETGKPLVVHVREAWDDAMAILAQERADLVVLHCFSGDPTIAREAAARGYFVSFAANVTYPKAEGLRRSVAVIDEDRLVVETDSPFLPPQSARGESNRPANLPAVLEAVATVRGVDPTEAVRQTARAAGRAFPFPR